MESPNMLNYESRERKDAARSSTLGAIFALLTLATSFLPIWLNYSAWQLIPAYIGFVIMVVGLRPLFRSRRWGILCELFGSLLLSIDLAGYVVMLAHGLWKHPEQITDWDLYGILLMLAFLFDIGTIILLARRLRWS